MSAEKKVVLYDLTVELNSLNDLMKMDGGEITPEFEELEKEVIKSLALKVDGYIGFSNMLEDEISSAQRRVKELNSFISVRKNSIDRLKAYALMALEASKTDKFVGEFGQISTRKPTKVLRIDDEGKVPMEYVSSKTVHTIDNKAIKDVLKKGTEVEGCCLVDGKKSVSFKSKSVKGK